MYELIYSVLEVIVVNNLKTRYGELKNLIIVGKYDTGEIEGIKFEDKNILNINGKEYIPVYELSNPRGKEIPAIVLLKNGDIKALALQEATEVATEYGKIKVEKIIFYQDGKFKRLFFLNGRLSGFWSEEDEYNLAKEYCFNLSFGKINAKFISMQLYNSQRLKSLTLWPKEVVDVEVNNIKIKTRIGISLFEDGTIQSCEPMLPININTPIGEIEAYDKNAIGIHGEDNSLKFNRDGSIHYLITSTNIINVFNDKGELIAKHSPREERLFVNSDILDVITISIEFEGDRVIIDQEYQYSIDKNHFLIEQYGEKKLTLSGDV